MAEKKPMGTLFIEADLNLTKAEQKLQALHGRMVAGATKSEEAFKALGISSDRMFAAQKATAEAAYKAIANNAQSTANDIIKAEQAKTAKLKALQDEQTGNATKSIQSHESSMAGLTRSVLRLYAAYYVLSTGIDLVFGRTAQYMSTIETSSLGMAAAYMTGGKYIDTMTGKVLSGQAAFKAAQEDTKAVMADLQKANFATIATLDQLVRGYQQTLPVALAKGFNKQQVLEFTKSLVQAAGAIDPMLLNQLGEESRALLTGSISEKNSRIAVALGLRPEDIKQFKGNADELYRFLMKKLEAYTYAGMESQKTWAGLWSNTADIALMVGGQVFSPLFDQIKYELTAIQNKVLDIDEKTGKVKGFKPEFLESIEGIKRGIGSIIDVSSSMINITSKTINIIIDYRDEIIALTAVWGGAKLATAAVALNTVNVTTAIVAATKAIQAMNLATFTAGLISAGQATAILSYRFATFLALPVVATLGGWGLIIGSLTYGVTKFIEAMNIASNIQSSKLNLGAFKSVKQIDAMIAGIEADSKSLKFQPKSTWEFQEALRQKEIAQLELQKSELMIKRAQLVSGRAIGAEYQNNPPRPDEEALKKAATAQERITELTAEWKRKIDELNPALSTVDMGLLKLKDDYEKRIEDIRKAGKDTTVTGTKEIAKITEEYEKGKTYIVEKAVLKQAEEWKKGQKEYEKIMADEMSYGVTEHEKAINKINEQEKLRSDNLLDMLARDKISIGQYLKAIDVLYANSVSQRTNEDIKEANRLAELKASATLSSLNVAEKTYTMPREEIAAKRVTTTEDQLSAYEKSLTNMKAGTVEWQNQMKLIEEARAKLLDFKLAYQELNGTMGEGMTRGGQEWLASLKSQFQIGEEAVKSTADTMKQSFENFLFDPLEWKFEDFTNSLRRILAKATTDMIADLIRVQTQAAMLDSSSGGSWLSSMGTFFGLGNTSSGAANAGTSAGTNIAAAFVAHTGGEVGVTSFPTRSVDPAIFAGAPRLHNGLANDEFPTILQQGEKVIPRNKSFSGSNNTVVVYMNVNAADSKSFNQMMYENKSALTSMIQSALKDNHPSRRS